LVPRPPKPCLVSREVDIYPRYNHHGVQLLVTRLGRRSDFSKRTGFFVDCMSPDLATLPDGWMERLVPFRTKNTAGVTGWCLEIHDLVVSKLAAGREKDLKYINALLSRALVRPLTLKKRIEAVPVTTEHIALLQLRLKKLLGRKVVSRQRTSSRQ
jgi:uncharacterized nucleotidyltransferase DUF6036